jgi:hypothetical protein
MTFLIFIVAIVWGALPAQFLVQTITSLVVVIIYLSGLAFSDVPKSRNATPTSPRLNPRCPDHLPHFSLSVAIILANSAGEPGSASPP